MPIYVLFLSIIVIFDDNGRRKNILANFVTEEFFCSQFAIKSFTNSFYNYVYYTYHQMFQKFL